MDRREPLCTQRNCIPGHVLQTDRRPWNPVLECPWQRTYDHVTHSTPLQSELMNSMTTLETLITIRSSNMNGAITLYRGLALMLERNHTGTAIIVGLSADSVYPLYTESLKWRRSSG